MIDVIAINETFLIKKHDFKIPGYDTISQGYSIKIPAKVFFLLP